MFFDNTSTLSPPNSVPNTPIPTLDRFPVVEDENIYDLIGIGIGPTHLALAIAFKESKKSSNCLFMEVKDSFSW